MVTRLLNLDVSPQTDTADAMAVALTHIHLGAFNPR
jgi:Holliday junction resolvasome RuvABC endonuclease subunit